MAEHISTIDDPMLEILRRRGAISAAIAKSVLVYRKTWKLSSYDAVLETNTLSETRLADILAEELKYQRIHQISHHPFNLQVLSTLSYEKAVEWSCIPLARLDSGEVEVVVANPLQPNLKEMLSQSIAAPVGILIGEKTDIQAAILLHYPAQLQMPSLFRGSALS